MIIVATAKIIKSTLGVALKETLNYILKPFPLSWLQNHSDMLVFTWDTHSHAKFILRRVLSWIAEALLLKWLITDNPFKLLFNNEDYH